MTHLQQPDGSKLCGQTCVAIIAGVTIGEALAVSTTGRQRASSEFDLRRGLQRFGFTLGPFTTWRRARQPLADLPVTEIRDRYLTKAVLCRVRHVRRRLGYHWIVITRTDVHDPLLPAAMAIAPYETLMGETAAYVSSWARVSAERGR